MFSRIESNYALDKKQILQMHSLKLVFEFWFLFRLLKPFWNLEFYWILTCSKQKTNSEELKWDKTTFCEIQRNKIELSGDSCLIWFWNVSNRGELNWLTELFLIPHRKFTSFNLIQIFSVNFLKFYCQVWDCIQTIIHHNNQLTTCEHKFTIVFCFFFTIFRKAIGLTKQLFLTLDK